MWIVWKSDCVEEAVAHRSWRFALIVFLLLLVDVACLGVGALCLALSLSM